MKCPKCGYFGFETTDRCRHCGYDFSLAVPSDPVSELPLRPRNEPEAPLVDLDLDRVIGAGVTTRDEPPPTPTPSRVELTRGPAEHAAAALPLFTRHQTEPDDMPLVPAPRPARPPLAVRRATPEVARRRTPRTVRQTPDPELQLEPAPATTAPDAAPVSPADWSPSAHSVVDAAPKARRVAAACVDAILLGSINAAILYLTLAIVSLPMTDVLTLPLVPMGAFLLLLNSGYLVAFTAANGQTIGKMMFRVRVIAEDRGRVDIPGSVLRAAGVLLTVATFGIAYVPALVSRDGRTLHDRLAKTRVIRHA